MPPKGDTPGSVVVRLASRGDPGIAREEAAQVPEGEAMGGAVTWGGPWMRRLDAYVEAVVGISLFGEMVLVFGTLALRLLFNVQFLGVNEIASFVLGILAFCAGALAYRRGEHMAVHMVIKTFGPRTQEVFHALVDWLVLGFGALIFILSIPPTLTGLGEVTPVLAWNGGLAPGSLTVGALLLAVYAAAALVYRHRRSTVLKAGAGLVCALVVIMATRGVWQVWFTGSVATWGSVCVFLALLMVSVPVGFALGFTALTYLFMTGAQPLGAVALTLQDGASQFVLLALPFFIFAGFVMDQGGISARLVAFVAALIGHLRGGLLQVMVVSMYIVSGLSGSKTADVAAVGMPLVGQLKKNGYDLDESVAVLAASGAMGETIPPSIAILVLGSVTSLSIGSLFLAGMLPAAFVAMCLMLLIYVRMRMTGQGHGVPFNLEAVLFTAPRAILPLLMPVVLVGGILTGVGTPTEVSSIAGIYGLVLAVLIYREMGFKKFWSTLIAGASMSGMILFIVAAGTAFSRVMAIAGFPQQVAAVMESLPEWEFLLVSAFLMVGMGTLLEGVAALLIFGPLLVPIAAAFHLSTLHYGIIIIMAFGIGTFMPPIGVGLYVACSVGKASLEGASRAMLPYVAVLLAGLLLVTYVPWLSLVVPQAFGVVGGH